MKKRKFTVTFTTLELEYQNASLQYIRGFQDGDSETPAVGDQDDTQNDGFSFRLPL
jgi:hypothetical protein